MGLRRLPTRFRRRPPRKPWEPRFVFVVTYGRSGSTLLQGLVNALPGALLRGENNFYLLHIFRAWADLRSFRRQYAKDADRGPRSAFYGLDETSMRDFVHMARRLVIRQLLGSVDRGDVELLGFKEVLWHRVEPEETAAFFAFLEALFPGAVYLLNQRAHDAVASSGFCWSLATRPATA